MLVSSATFENNKSGQLEHLKITWDLICRPIKISIICYLSPMKLKSYLFAGVMILFGWTVNAQIEVLQKPNNTFESKPVNSNQSTAEFFVLANRSKSHRKLIENPANGGVFAEPLDERENEESLNVWSLGVGIRDRILPHLTWEGGITYFQNGESYLFESSDTLHSYESTYKYIGMPIKAYYTYGNDVRLYVGGGIVPQLFTRYEQDRRWENAANTKTQETYTTQNGYRSFVLSAVANIGVQLNMGRNVSILVVPEYRLQLISSNVDTSPYAHFGRSMGVNMGLTYKF